jgi:hypothetical protein
MECERPRGDAALRSGTLKANGSSVPSTLSRALSSSAPKPPARDARSIEV